MAEPEAKKPEAQPAEGQQPPPAGEQDNSTIREMRAELERTKAAEREAREQMKLLNTTLKERQRAEMSEQDRLRAELEEVRNAAAQLEHHRDELGRWQSWAQKDYEGIINRIEDPETRQAVQRMSSSGDWRERLESLKGAQEIVSQLNRAKREAEKTKAELERAQQQTAYGTRTQPAAQRLEQQPSRQPERQGPITKQPWSTCLTPIRRPGRSTDNTDT